MAVVPILVAAKDRERPAWTEDFRVRRSPRSQGRSRQLFGSLLGVFLVFFVFLCFAFLVFWCFFGCFFLVFWCYFWVFFWCFEWTFLGLVFNGFLFFFGFFFFDVFGVFCLVLLRWWFSSSSSACLSLEQSCFGGSDKRTSTPLGTLLSQEGATKRGRYELLFVSWVSAGSMGWVSELNFLSPVKNVYEQECNPHGGFLVIQRPLPDFLS